ncbi:MAG: carph-isopro domain-containing protein [Novosphingobium sp.]|uniref:carph-isopro domain-containing protein n=1 Tax=Novosphingobium sp. TaxID=1874826 RepID=UPI003B992529
MPNAAQIIEALGGTVAVARALSLAPTTVSSWKQSGRIPKWRMQDVKAFAAEGGVDLDALAAPPQVQA